VDSSGPLVIRTSEKSTFAGMKLEKH